MTTTNTSNAPARPTHVMHPTINLLCEAMRRADREQFVHYAGAAYRDEHAWQFCIAWLAAPMASHEQLNRAALTAIGWL